MFDIFGRLLATGNFMSHGHCYLWNSTLVRMHFLSDSLIGASYVAISLTLLHLVHRAKRDIPFHWIILAFGAFIIACGGTHLMEVWTIWTPVYWFSGWVKIVTAAASVTTALVLPPLVPKTLQLIQDAKRSRQNQQDLQAAHQELEKLYEQVKEADRLKTQFFANVSHELRTPVALILGPVENLLVDSSLPPKQRHELEVVGRNARTLLKHINDLLDLSRLESGTEPLQRSPVDLAELLRLAAGNFELVAAEWGITFSVEAPERIPARIDADKLHRVFLNLLTNAFRFTAADGRVECRLWSEGDRAIATVKDTGPGIPPDMLETIFERFQQSQDPSVRLFRGAGLGLAIAKQFVGLHNGRIIAANVSEGGAIFQVEIPLEPAGAESAAVPAQEAQPLRELTRASAVVLDRPPEQAQDTDQETFVTTAQPDDPLVLVVEDNREMARFIGELLAKEYRVAWAADGREGLEKALSLQPDLVVCDIMMPEMSGEDMVRKLRSRPGFGNTPIVMLTARADDDLRQSLLGEFVQDYVTKPVRSGELLARVRNLVLAGQREAALRLSQEELQHLAGRLISAQEQERARVARELHDGLNQRLAALTINLGALQSRLSEPEVMGQQIVQLERQLLEISKEVRWISHQLHPPALEHVGLAPALESHCSEFSAQTDIQVIFLCPNELPQIPADVAGGLFRLTQEALQNAAKHSGAREVRVTLHAEENRVSLSVADNGSGFDRVEARAKRGLGLVSMGERVRSFGGSLLIESALGKGTTIEVQIPLEAK